MKRITFCTAFTIAMAMTLPAMAQTVTATGNNGGSVGTTHSCARGDKSANCTNTTTATSASGQTAQKTHARSTSQGGSTTTTTRAANGQSNTRARSVAVSN